MKNGVICAAWLLSAAHLLLAAPVPKIAMRDNLIEPWQAALSGGRAAAELIEPQFGTAPISEFKDGVVVLPVNFAGTTFERASWDLKGAVDMSSAKGITFDFFCADITAFASFSLYLHADGRWLQAGFSPETQGSWTRITLLKRMFKEDDSSGKIRGCRQVDRIRISGWRLKDVETTCALANPALIPAEPDILIIQGLSSAANRDDENQFIQYAQNIEKTVAALEIEALSVSDRNLSPAALQGTKIAVLAYSTALPPHVLPLLQSYLRDGGRLICFYTLPAGFKELLGVKQGGWIKDPAGHFAGFSRSNSALPDQPEFAPHPSWCANEYHPDPARSGGRVAAVWRSGAGEDTAHPAIVITGAGAVFGHVWLGGADPQAARLLMSVIGELAPSLWEKRARIAFAGIGRMEEIRDYAEFCRFFESPERKARSATLFEETAAMRRQAQSALERGQWAESCAASARAAELAVKCRCTLFCSAAEEQRAFWCHSAFGLNGRSWDESIRFLKEHGFNAIIPNMAWGATAYYPSTVLPVHPSVAERGDQIQLCLAACRKYGVACHIWKVCWNTGHRAPREFEQRLLAEGRVQISRSGTRDDLWLCPSHPENQRLEIEAQLEVVRNYAVDGVHFDYIRYPGAHYCYCEGCRTRFEAAAGFKVERWPEDTLKGGVHCEKYLDFRRAAITHVVREVAERAAKIRPGVAVSAAVFRNAPVDRDSVGQDWQLWCEKGWLDFVCPMDYTDSPAAFRNMVDQQKMYAGKVPLYPGIGLSCWQDESNYALKLCHQITIARAAGLKGFTVFNFDANAEQVLPYLSLGLTKP